ncbi:hypothetical protein BDZ45DRAFT_747336 [Acephala macrosclerotiorum]|nr:hypothetical protein BDZ45DRAFT_747336 [Acephala macrosclerotiorum]
MLTLTILAILYPIVFSSSPDAAEFSTFNDYHAHINCLTAHTAETSSSSITSDPIPSSTTDHTRKMATKTYKSLAFKFLTTAEAEEALETYRIFENPYIESTIAVRPEFTELKINPVEEDRITPRPWSRASAWEHSYRSWEKQRYEEMDRKERNEKRAEGVPKELGANKLFRVRKDAWEKAPSGLREVVSIRRRRTGGVRKWKRVEGRLVRL